MILRHFLLISTFLVLIDQGSLPQYVAKSIEMNFEISFLVKLSENKGCKIMHMYLL